MANAENDYMCILCNGEGHLRCGRCKDVRYFSRECQRADWRTHKLLCKYNLDFATSRRPSPSHVRAILFPEKEETPRFVWIRGVLTASDNPALAFDFSPLVQDGAKATADSTIIGNGILCRALHPHMVVCKIENSTSAETKSLSNIDPRISMAFTGSLIFIGETDNARHPVATDLTTSHLRHVIDELAIRSDIQRRASQCFTDLSLEKRTGVVVNSVGDMQTFLWPMYQRFDFHPTGEYTAGFAAPAAIDIPLCIYKIEQSVSGIGRTWSTEQNNAEHEDGPDYYRLAHDFNHIHLWLTNPVKCVWYHFAMIPGPVEHRIHHPGSFLVARVDGKPLYPIHLDAMYAYFRNRLIEYGEERSQYVVLPSGQATISLSEAAFTSGPWLNKLSKDGFEAWYEDFVRQTSIQRLYPRANETLGPYEV